MTSNRKPRRRRANSVDVARAAGVSQATVSYVYNGRKGNALPEATRQRVLQAAQELGYSPNRTAQSLKTGQTHVIAFWTSHLHTPVSALVLRQVHQHVEANGYEVIVSANFKSGAVSNWPVDGILAFDSIYHLQELMRQDKMPQVPLVSMGPFHLENVDYVGVDLYSGARAGIAHLLEATADTGKPVTRRRIAYAVESGAKTPGQQRYDAYAAVMQESGCAPEYIVLSDQTRNVAHQEIKAYFQQHGAPDALFCMNDELAIGAQRAAHELGLSIPKDVAILGCDGIEETAYHEPPISTIVQPLEELCARGWQFLSNRLCDPDMPLQQVMLIPRLELRASTQR